MVYATTCYSLTGCEYKVHKTRQQLETYALKKAPLKVYSSEHENEKAAKRFIKKLKLSTPGF